MPSVRHPAVAGRFYPRDRGTLLDELQSYLSPATCAAPALGCVVPHAGYMYSGAVAGAVFARIEVPQRCIVLCPNHTGMGRPLAIMSEGTWETPLGAVSIDSALAEDLKQRCPLLNENEAAHHSEHAIEVQLPFLQARRRQFTFVPIALGTSQYEVLEKLGQVLAEAVRAETQKAGGVKAENEKLLIVASSDMNHYENDRVTRVKDHKAIERLLALDPRGLYDVVTNEDISMCGFGPAVVMLTAARHLGASCAELVKYATSADVSGDREMVVGYAGVLVH